MKEPITILKATLATIAMRTHVDALRCVGQPRMAGSPVLDFKKLLVSLFHFCDAFGLNFYDLLSEAESVYIEEATNQGEEPLWQVKGRMAAQRNSNAARVLQLASRIERNMPS